MYYNNDMFYTNNSFRNKLRGIGDGLERNL